MGFLLLFLVFLFSQFFSANKNCRKKIHFPNCLFTEEKPKWKYFPFRPPLPLSRKWTNRKSDFVLRFFVSLFVCCCSFHRLISTENGILRPNPLYPVLMCLEQTIYDHVRAFIPPGVSIGVQRGPITGKKSDLTHEWTNWLFGDSSEITAVTSVAIAMMNMEHFFVCARQMDWDRTLNVCRNRSTPKQNTTEQLGGYSNLSCWNITYQHPCLALRNHREDKISMKSKQGHSKHTGINWYTISQSDGSLSHGLPSV